MDLTPSCDSSCDSAGALVGAPPPSARRRSLPPSPPATPPPPSPLSVLLPAVRPRLWEGASGSLATCLTLTTRMSFPSLTLMPLHRPWPSAAGLMPLSSWIGVQDGTAHVPLLRAAGWHLSSPLPRSNLAGSLSGDRALPWLHRCCPALLPRRWRPRCIPLQLNPLSVPPFPLPRGSLSAAAVEAETLAEAFRDASLMGLVGPGQLTVPLAPARPNLARLLPSRTRPLSRLSLFRSRASFGLVGSGPCQPRCRRCLVWPIPGVSYGYL